MDLEIVEIVCPKCGHNKSYKKIIGSFEGGECIECGWLTYYKKLDNAPLKYPKMVKCPYCNSTDTRKISAMSKAGSVALWGVFASRKISKQWHCNDCKSDF